MPLLSMKGTREPNGSIVRLLRLSRPKQRKMLIPKTDLRKTTPAEIWSCTRSITEVRTLTPKTDLSLQERTSEPQNRALGPFYINRDPKTKKSGAISSFFLISNWALRINSKP